MRSLRAALAPATAVALTSLVAMVQAGCGGGGGGGGVDPPRNPAAPDPVVPARNLASFTIGLPSPYPGQSTEGRVTLSESAPPQGVVVTFAASDAHTVTVPSSITVSAGAVSATVPILTRRTDADTIVIVSASAGAGSQSASVPVGAGSFLSFASQPGHSVGQGRSLRITPSDYGFDASVSHTLDRIFLMTRARSSTAWWTLILRVPAGQELRSGIYPGVAPSTDPNSSSIDFSGGTVCTPVAGGFQIMDVQYGPGPSLERLHAQFTHSCNGTASLSGEVYLVQ